MTTPSTRRISLRVAASLTLAALLGVAHTSGAQSPTAASGAAASSWSAWFGCWTPRSGRTTDEGPARRCVVPGPDAGSARMLTLAGDRVLVDEVVAANGQPETMTDAGCTGERVGRWAHAGPRVFVSSTLRCEGKPTVSTSGISTLVGIDTWLDVQVASVEGREDVRVAQFRRASDPLPALVAQALGTTARTRRVVTAIAADDVTEASGMVSASAVEAWVAESGLRVPINSRVLRALSAGGTSPRVIDLLVAQAFPEKFQVRRSNAYGGGSISVSGPFIDDFVGAGPWGPYSDFYAYGTGFGAFGLPGYAYGNRYGYPYGFVPYAFNVEPGGGGAAAADADTHGRVVNGVGYTRIQTREPVQATAAGQGSTTRGAASSGAESSGSGSGSGGGSVSSGASPGGYSGGGGTSTGLTAVPR